jgi:hypothetical protein
MQSAIKLLEILLGHGIKLFQANGLFKALSLTVAPA